MGKLNAVIGWGLAVVAIAVGYTQYGWRGVVLGVTVVVFWLLLQFTRALRAMREASAAPVGQVASAVMLHSKLVAGQRLIDVLKLTRSLGERQDAAAGEERYVWRDESGASVTLTLTHGRLSAWQLHRPAGPAA